MKSENPSLRFVALDLSSELGLDPTQELLQVLQDPRSPQNSFFIATISYLVEEGEERALPPLEATGAIRQSNGGLDLSQGDSKTGLPPKKWTSIAPF